MQGEVAIIMRNGVVARLDGHPQIGDLFQIYRVENGVETIVGNGYMRKPKAGGWKINPIDKQDGSRGDQYVDVRVGDLVRSIETL